MRHRKIALRHEAIRVLMLNGLPIRGGEPDSSNCDTGHESVSPYACPSDTCPSIAVCQTLVGPCG